MPGNNQAVAAYFRSANQWLLAPSGLRLGLLAPSVESVLRQMGLDGDLETFDQVMMIGSEVAGQLNKKAEKESE